MPWDRTELTAGSDQGDPYEVTSRPELDVVVHEQTVVGPTSCCCRPHNGADPIFGDACTTALSRMDDRIRIVMDVGCRQLVAFPRKIYPDTIPGGIPMNRQGHMS